ncbi:MAG: DHHA1 domain-containing protein, partial [Terriglobales bacterium]
LKMRAAQGQAGGSGAARQEREVNGIKVVTSRVDGLERSQLRTLADELRHKLGSGVVALGGVQDEKFALIVAVTADLAPRLNAGAILKAIPGIKGGGRPELAEAGGTGPEQLDRALAQVFEAVGAQVPLSS